MSHLFKIHAVCKFGCFQVLSLSSGVPAQSACLKKYKTGNVQNGVNRAKLEKFMLLLTPTTEINTDGPH